MTSLNLPKRMNELSDGVIRRSTPRGRGDVGPPGRQVLASRRGLADVELDENQLAPQHHAHSAEADVVKARREGRARRMRRAWRIIYRPCLKPEPFHTESQVTGGRGGGV